MMSTQEEHLVRKSLAFVFQSQHSLGMDTNIIGLLATAGQFILIVISAWICSKKLHMDKAAVRKLIHIMAAQWWFILASLFTNMWFALLMPLSFVVANWLLMRGKLGIMFGFRSPNPTWGVVWYPVSLAVLVILLFQNSIPKGAAASGFLIMGYGDGFSALIGRAWGKARLPGYMKEKTWVGTISMFFISAIVAACCIRYYHIHELWLLTGIFTGLVSAVLEAATPRGLDNITVPLGAALMVTLLCSM